MSTHELDYACALRKILDFGNKKEDRTGVGTISSTAVNLSWMATPDRFPILTAKKVNFKALWAELLWIMRGSTNSFTLNHLGTKIWDQWATKEQCERFGRDEGDIGPTYGHQWRCFGGMYEEDGRDEDHCAVHGFDQIVQLVKDMQDNPFSRRLLVSAWHPYQATQVAVPPCPTLFQLVCIGLDEGQRPIFDLVLYQRSGDMFIGVPFDMAAYSLLLNLLCWFTNSAPNRVHYTIADAHIYLNHVDQTKEYLERVTSDKMFIAPCLEMHQDIRGIGIEGLHQTRLAHVTLHDYEHGAYIKAPVAE